ncbi:ABC transporter transmembrane domain-containing protein [Arthrobacter alpinus]|nr:ABC transporter transmembrane domain-containing protein [Arthrobacter alpinus]
MSLTLVQSVSATLRHRAAVSNWMQAAYRSSQVVGYKVTRSGDALPQKFSTGEVVSTSASDAMRIGEIFDVAARLVGSLVGYLLVSYLVFQSSWELGVVVLVGVPLCGVGLLFVIRPLQRRQKDQREAAGQMTALGADTVAGLRVLRGIGGEHIFVERYRERSRATQLAGNKVAYSLADLDAAQVFVVGVFSVAFTWLCPASRIGSDRGRSARGALWLCGLFSLADPHRRRRRLPLHSRPRWCKTHHRCVVHALCRARRRDNSSRTVGT